MEREEVTHRQQVLSGRDVKFKHRFGNVEMKFSVTAQSTE
jgi:hypothetical protein